MFLYVLCHSIDLGPGLCSTRIREVTKCIRLAYALINFTMAKSHSQKSSSSQSSIQTNLLKNFRNVPKLVVFDLDYTLWPYWVDTHIDLPIKKKSDGTVCDASGTKLRIYSEVVNVLDTLKSNKILIAAASRTHQPPAARDMLNYFNLNKYFDYKEIYPGEKTTHFHKINKDSKIKYEDMLFFDDENRNIVTISQLNVVCYLVKEEVNMKTLHEGLALFDHMRKHS